MHRERSRREEVKRRVEFVSREHQQRLAAAKEVREQYWRARFAAEPVSSVIAAEAVAEDESVEDLVSSGMLYQLLTSFTSC
jgi:hypothetical protein